MLEFERQNGELTIRGREYRVEVRGGDRPRARLWLRGQLVANLPLISSCDADGQADVPGPAEPPSVRWQGERLLLELGASSRLWPRRSAFLLCGPDGLEHWHELHGRGAVDQLHFFAAWHDEGQLCSPTASFTRLFNPEPNSLGVQELAPEGYAVIGVGRDKSYHEGNWFFTPGPFCYALEAGAGNWMGMGVSAPLQEQVFSDFEHLGSGALRLRYDGHLRVDGVWETPRLVLRPSPGDAYESVEDFCEWLRQSGYSPVGPRREPPAWWREPIFCGWGEQCALGGYREQDGLEGLVRRAALAATQANYGCFLAQLAQQGLQPGTVVIDDKWQRHYGLNDPDADKWPDLRGFIAHQHAQGRRVLLWLKAWDPEGLPPEECVRDGEGRGVTVDPSNPTYQARLRAQVRAMLLGLGADGFKLDFTHLTPRGPGLEAHGPLWGVALLRQLLGLIADEIAQAKPEAMLMAHTANPAFADLVDVLRLNDVPKCLPGQGYLERMRHRGRVARAASPGWLIDTDNWPSPSRAALREYLAAQAELGIPSLYYVTRLLWRTDEQPLCDQPLLEEDYRAIAESWRSYRAGGIEVGQVQSSVPK